MVEAILNRELSVLGAFRPIHWLQEKVTKIKSDKILWWRAVLRKHQLELVPGS